MRLFERIQDMNNNSLLEHVFALVVELFESHGTDYRWKGSWSGFGELPIFFFRVVKAITEL